MVDLEQSRDVIRVVEAAKKSSEEGRPQALNWTSEASEGPGGGDHSGANGIEPAAGQEPGGD